MKINMKVNIEITGFWITETALLSLRSLLVTCAAWNTLIV